MARRRFSASQLASHTPAPDSARRRCQAPQETPPPPPPPQQPQPLGVKDGGVVGAGFRAGVVREVLASLRARRGVTAAYGLEERAEEEEAAYRDTPRLVVDPTPDWRGLRVLPPSLPLRFHFPYSCPHCDEILPVKSALDSNAYSVAGLTVKPININRKQQANTNKDTNKPQQAEAQSSPSPIQQQVRDNSEGSESAQPSWGQHHQQQQQRDTTTFVSVRAVACQTVAEAGTQTEGNGDGEHDYVGLRHVGIDDAVRVRRGEQHYYVAQRPSSASEMTRPQAALRKSNLDTSSSSSSSSSLRHEQQQQQRKTKVPSFSTKQRTQKQPVASVMDTTVATDTKSGSSIREFDLRRSKSRRHERHTKADVASSPPPLASSQTTTTSSALHIDVPPYTDPQPAAQRDREVDSLAELERMIEEQHRALVLNGVLPPDDIAFTLSDIGSSALSLSLSSLDIDGLLDDFTSTTPAESPMPIPNTDVFGEGHVEGRGHQDARDEHVSVSISVSGG